MVGEIAGWGWGRQDESKAGKLRLQGGGVCLVGKKGILPPSSIRHEVSWRVLCLYGGIGMTSDHGPGRRMVSKISLWAQSSAMAPAAQRTMHSVLGKKRKIKARVDNVRTLE
jgi:hypothetical protein